MNHPLTSATREIEFLETRLRKAADRIEALETVNADAEISLGLAADRIEALEAALRKIAWLMEGDNDVSEIARAALAPEENK